MERGPLCRFHDWRWQFRPQPARPRQFQRDRHEPPGPFVNTARYVDPVNHTNTFISYYTHGQAIALGVDLEIRSRFPGKSLDDWMR